jgi:hypothetical protein
VDLAAQTVALLVPFLGQVGGHMVSKVAADLNQAVIDRLDRLYQRVKSRLNEGDPARAALRRLEAEPQDERVQESFRTLLAQVLEQDRVFAHELSMLVAQIEVAAPALTQINQSGATAVGGGEVRIAGDYAAGRDITIHQHPPAGGPGPLT